LAQKRAKIEQGISDAERRKATKEGEAQDKEAKASRTTSASMAALYKRQAESARKVAVSEGTKIAALAKKRAELSKEEVRLN
jgi:hypothetical protein